MSVTRKFIDEQIERHSRNIEYFENMRIDIAREKKLNKSELVKGGLALQNEQTCRQIKKEQNSIKLYEKILNDKDFKISDIDYIIDNEDFSEEHLNLIIDVCINYQKFIESGINESHYNRDAEAIENNFFRTIEMIEVDSYILQPKITIPLSPTMIREELLNNLIRSGYKKDKYLTLLEFIPIGGKKQPRGYKKPPIEEDIAYSHRNSKKELTANGKTFTITTSESK